MSGREIEPSVLALGENKLEQQYIDDGLSTASTGRNIALAMVVDSWGAASGSDVDELFNTALMDVGSDYTISRNYSRSQFLNWPASGVAVLDAGRGRFGSTNHSGLYSAFGGHVARLCTKHGVAPADLVGMRGAVKREDALKPYYSRMAIYAALALLGADKPVSVPDLAVAAGVYEDTVRNHLPHMARSGVIEPQSDGRRFLLPKFIFSQSSDDVELANLPPWNERTKDLAAVSLAILYRTAKPLDAGEIRVQLQASDLLQNFVRSKQLHKQNEIINKVLEWLSEHGYLEQAEPGQEATSEVSLSEQGVDIIGSYFDIFSSFVRQEPQFLSTGRRISDEILADKNRLAHLLTVDFEKGAITRRKPAAERTHELQSILSAHPEGLTSGALQVLCGLKPATLNRIMNSMERGGMAYGRRAARTILWFANQPGGDA